MEVRFVCFEEIDEIAAGFFEDLEAGREAMSENSAPERIIESMIRESREGSRARSGEGSEGREGGKLNSPLEWHRCASPPPG